MAKYRHFLRSGWKPYRNRSRIDRDRGLRKWVRKGPLLPLKHIESQKKNFFYSFIRKTLHYDLGNTFSKLVLQTASKTDKDWQRSGARKMGPEPSITPPLLPLKHIESQKKKFLYIFIRKTLHYDLGNTFSKLVLQTASKTDKDWQRSGQRYMASNNCIFNEPLENF
jgi:hypothetical protein